MGFSSDIDRWVRKTKEAVNAVARESAAEVERRVVDRSPVDTGRFKNAWKMDDQWDDEWKREGVIRITNDVEYGPALEDGHSGQAPHGMVKVTAAQWRGIVADAVRKRGIVRGKAILNVRTPMLLSANRRRFRLGRRELAALRNVFSILTRLIRLGR